MTTLWALLAGMFIANGIPHFVKGISGETFPTMIKKQSSATLNVFWGSTNFAIGLIFLNLATPGGAVPLGTDRWVFLAGAFVMAVVNANFFSKGVRLPWWKD